MKGKWRIHMMQDCAHVLYNILNRPCLIVNDLDLARNILIKDFDHFTDRRIFAIDTTSESNKLVANMLTMLTGEKWKKVRSMMSPAFTSGKLKAMAPFIDKVRILAPVPSKIRLPITCFFFLLLFRLVRNSLSILVASLKLEKSSVPRRS